MPEECIYYCYDSGYTCLLKRRKTGYSSIDSDTVHRYCWNYQYDDCPMYRKRDEYWDSWSGCGGDSSDGCFLTSACVEAKGLPDDCRELTVLRRFRDAYMRNTEQGQADILDYYAIAPDIVNRIRREEDPLAVFERIYRELVLPCVALIDEGQNEEAYEKYKEYTLMLKSAYSG